MNTLRDATTLTPTADGAWTAEVPEDWGQGRATFGGLLTGFALRAAAARVPEPRPLRSVLVDFVGPAGPGPVRVEATMLRTGRALTQVEARVFQADDPVVVVVAAYGAPRDTGIRCAPSPGVAQPTPAGLPAFPHVAGVTPAFTRHFDYRWATDRLPFTGADTADIRGWVRERGAQPVDAAAALALIDAWPAPVLSLAAAPFPASTVTWMVDFVAPDALGAAAPGAWWFFHGTTVAAGDGYAHVEGRLTDAAGRLVAVSRQLVAEFSPSRT